MGSGGGMGYSAGKKKSVPGNETLIEGHGLASELCIIMHNA